MPTLGQAYVQIVPSAEGISSSISDVLSGPADKAGKDAGGKFGTGFGSKLKSGLAMAGVGVAAFGAMAGAALGKSISDVAKYGDNVDKMSQKIGFSAEGFQKWDYVLQRAGTNINNMAPVMKTLSNAAASNSDAFKQLGISQEEVANMSQEELFGRTIEALSGMEEGAERTALANKLLGRGATELQPLMNEGTEAIREQMEMAEQYGMVLSDDSVKAAADFVDAQTTLSMTIDGLKNKLAAEFLPACTDVTNGLAKMFSGDMSGLEDIKAGIGEFVSSIASQVPGMIEAGGQLLVNLIQGITEKLPEMATAAAEAIRGFAEGFGEGSEGAAELITKAGELMTSFGGALLEAAGILIPAVIDAMWAFFTETDWIGLGTSVVQMLIDAFNTNFPIAVDLVKGVVKDIATKLGFTGLAAKVKRVFDSVKEKIISPINKAKDLVSSAIEKIKGFFPISIGKIFSNVKLPHFSVSGGEAPWGFMGQGSLPHVSIDWYAKGGIMTKPTLFGGGEAGAEGIVPLDPFWDRMDKMADSIVDGVSSVVGGAAGMGGDVYVTLYAYPGGPQMDQVIVRSYDRGKRNGLK